jgi:hypothetical protein
MVSVPVIRQRLAADGTLAGLGIVEKRSHFLAAQRPIHDSPIPPNFANAVL